MSEELDLEEPPPIDLKTPPRATSPSEQYVEIEGKSFWSVADLACSLFFFFSPFNVVGPSPHLSFDRMLATSPGVGWQSPLPEAKEPRTYKQVEGSPRSFGTPSIPQCL